MHLILLGSGSKTKNPKLSFRVCNTGGERGIRTPGPVTVNSFQDCRIRPLCHFSSMSLSLLIASANIRTFFGYANVFLENLHLFFKELFNRFICFALEVNYFSKKFCNDGVISNK
jgi:hypothetical protein